MDITCDSRLSAPFFERLQALSGEAFSQRVSDLKAPRQLALRLNPLKENRVALMHLLESLPNRPLAGPWEGTWLVTPEARSTLTRSELFTKGYFDLQDMASQAAIWILDPKPGEKILDLCAAPGGKTAALAARMENTGHIAAVEPAKSRFFRLKANLERLGVTNAKLYRHDGRKVGVKVPERFDRVLVDAPCSAEGRIRFDVAHSHPAGGARRRLALVARQRQLLRSAVRATRSGGVILYCTCTLAPEENEGVVARVLRECSESLKVLPIQIPLTAQTEGLHRWKKALYPDALHSSVRLWPNAQHIGFYYCLLRKLPFRR